MTTSRRSLGPVVALSLALAGVAGCSAADRAVLSAPACSDASASPAPEPGTPGQAVLIGKVVRGPLPPGPVPGWERVVSVADAGTALAAVHPGGTVSVVGVDHRGVMAGTAAGAEQSLAPRTVAGVHDAVSVAAVGSTFLVTRSDGSVTAWGDAFIASGGVRGDQRDQPTPATVPDVDDVVWVADGDLSALALRSDGRVLGWGINLTGTVGETTGTRVREIEDVPGSVSLANPGGAGVVATGAGEVCAWGNNVHGLLGVEPTGGQTTRPARIGDLTDTVQVAGGNDFALALDSRGEVRAWGRTVSGMLGDGTAKDGSTATPRRVAGLPPLGWIGASGAASYGIDRSGALWTWGRGDLADAYSGPDTRPYRVPLPGPARSVSGGVVLLRG